MALKCDCSCSDINNADSDGITPVMLSCLNGNLKSTQSPLALGADNSVMYILISISWHSNVIAVILILTMLILMRELLLC